MLEVQIENIVPVTEARDKFNQIIDQVENSDDLFVLTKNGKPSAIVVGVHHLEKLTGEKHDELMGNIAGAISDNAGDTVNQEAPLAVPVSEPAPQVAETLEPAEVPPIISPVDSAAAPAEPENQTQLTQSDQPVEVTQNQPSSPFTYDNVTKEIGEDQDSQGLLASQPVSSTPAPTDGLANENDSFALPNDPVSQTPTPPQSDPLQSANDTNQTNANPANTINPVQNNTGNL